MESPAPGKHVDKVVSFLPTHSARRTLLSENRPELKREGGKVFNVFSSTWSLKKVSLSSFLCLFKVYA